MSVVGGSSLFFFCRGLGEASISSAFFDDFGAADVYVPSLIV